MEEICSFEEVREIFENDEKTVSQARSIKGAGDGSSQLLLS